MIENVKFEVILFVKPFIMSALGDNPDLLVKRRNSLRATFHDYDAGVYFITICTANKAHYFGKIEDNEMYLSKIGQKADHDIKALAGKYDNIEIPMFVVMPNHIHLIIALKTGDTSDSLSPFTVGRIVSFYKAGIKRFAGRNGIEFKWQRGYYDHIVRGYFDLNPIADYILNNVARWSADKYNQ
jgi:REP element-mobilizing transposase RayT